MKGEMHTHVYNRLTYVPNTKQNNQQQQKERFLNAKKYYFSSHLLVCRSLDNNNSCGDFP